MIVTDEEIKNAVDHVINDKREELLEKRYQFPINQLLFVIKEGRMKWADGKKVKEQFDRSILALLGEKTEEDEKVYSCIFLKI